MQLAQVLQGLAPGRDVVPIDGADVVEAELLEQGAGQHHAFEVLLGAPRQLPHGRHLPQHLLAALAQVRVQRAGEGLGEVAPRAHRRSRKSTCRCRSGPPAGRSAGAGVIQGLEGHAGRQGAIADDGHGAPVLTLAGGGDWPFPSAALIEVLGVADAERCRIRSRPRLREGREPARAAYGAERSRRPVRTLWDRPGARRPRPAGHVGYRTHSAGQWSARPCRQAGRRDVRPAGADAVRRSELRNSAASCGQLRYAGGGAGPQGNSRLAAAASALSGRDGCITGELYAPSRGLGVTSCRW